MRRYSADPLYPRPLRADLHVIGDQVQGKGTVPFLLAKIGTVPPGPPVVLSSGGDSCFSGRFFEGCSEVEDFFCAGLMEPAICLSAPKHRATGGAAPPDSAACRYRLPRSA